MFDCTRCEKPVEEEGVLCEDCVEEDKAPVIIVPPPPPPKVSAGGNKQQPMQKPVIKETSRDRIPRVSGMARVTVYAYSVGIRGYRYTLSVPPIASIAWQKEMTGTQAVQFLRGIKSRGKNRRLESPVLLDVE